MSNWPLRLPEKAIVLPSGLQAGAICCSIVHVDDAVDAAVAARRAAAGAPALALGEDGDGVAVGREGEVAPDLAAEVSSCATRYWYSCE